MLKPAWIGRFMELLRKNKKNSYDIYRGIFYFILFYAIKNILINVTINIYTPPYIYKKYMFFHNNWCNILIYNKLSIT